MGPGGFTGGRVNYVNTDDPEANFMAADQKIVQFLPEVGGVYTTNAAYNVTFPNENNILVARFRSDALFAAVIGDVTNVVYFLARSPTNYAVVQTIDLGSHPNYLAWVYHQDTLAVGLANGNIAVLHRNTTTNTFALNQTINTNHTGGVANVVGTRTRIYSVGGTDSILQIFFLNTTTGLFSLNQTVTGVGAGTATALHIPVNRRQIAVGRSTGDIIILGHPNNNFIFANETVLTGAHGGSINFLRFTNNAWHLLSGATDGVVQLRTRLNNFATPYNITLNGQSGDYDDVNKQFTVGQYGNNDGNYTTLRLLATNCTTGTVNTTDQTRCTCPTGQVWLNGGCQTLICNNNTNFTNTDGSINTTDNSRSCNCNAGYVWNEGTQICDRNCNPSVTPNANGSNYEPLSCECNNGFQFDYNQIACVAYQNCNGIANSNGTNANSGACNCNSGFTFNTTFNSTGACVRDCSNIARTNGASSTDANGCNCAPGYNFNSGSSSCVLNCSQMVYSNGQTKNNGCKCRGGYRWDSTIGQCIASSHHSAAVALGVAIPLGILGLLALLGLLFLLCRPTPVPIPLPVPVAVPAPVVTSIIPVNNYPTTSQVITRPPVQTYVPQNVTSMTRLVPNAGSGFGTPFGSRPTIGQGLIGPSTGFPVNRF